MFLSREASVEDLRLRVEHLCQKLRAVGYTFRTGGRMGVE